MCGWPPARKDFLGVSAVRSRAVMCPAGVGGRWPQAVMGWGEGGVMKPGGSRCRMSRYRFASIRRSTDAAITLFHPRKPPARARADRSGRRRPGAELLLTHHHRPADARHLVGQRTGDDHALLLGQQFGQPWIVPGALAAQHRHRAIDQEPAQIAVATLRYRAELDLAAGALLARHQAEPGGEVPAALEGTPLVHHRRHCGCEGSALAGAWM